MVEKNIEAYLRKDGAAGARNQILVLASAACANNTVLKIAQTTNVPRIIHQHGCGHLHEDDIEQTARTLVGNACNPNVAACLVVGLGCELLDASDLAKRIISVSGKPVQYLRIQDAHGSINAVARGVAIVEELTAGTSSEKRVSLPLSSLFVGIAGNSDDSAAGGKEIGYLTDLLLDAGITVIQGETAELTGNTPGSLCDNDMAGNNLKEAFSRVREKTDHLGMDLEKLISERARREHVSQMGTARFSSVIRYAERTFAKGLVHMESTRFLPETVSGMTAAGAAIILLASGKRSRIGSPVAPVMRLGMDYPLKTESDAKNILREIMSTAGGRMEQTENDRLNTFAITRIAPST